MLEASWRVIARLGLDGTTTREIAREANYSTGVLAHYFKNKDEILRLALDYAHIQVRGRVNALRERLKGIELLRAVLAEALPLDYQRQLEMTLEVSFWARTVAQTSLRASQHADHDRWLTIVRELVQGAIAAGELPSDLDAADAAMTLIIFIDGLGLNGLLVAERIPSAKVEQLLDRQLQMLGASLPVGPRPARRTLRNSASRSSAVKELQRSRVEHDRSPT